ncbi:efflux transporter outer membrane subunit [Moraxella marmotae]|uniref:efflux transporter outer membrane subunit n=1 Tax=Moraxella marmotae TaxID=3344520 RepID=UPI0035F3E9CC
MKTSTTLRVLTLSVLSISMAACSSIPKKVDTSAPILAVPNVPMNDAYKVYDAETVSTAEAPSVASLRWQDFYTDEKLKSLIELALENNKDLQAAILAVQSARAQFQITQANSLPQVGSSAAATRQANNSIDANPATGYNVGLAMSSYELDLWGKVASQKEQALHQYLATNAAKDAAQISIISGVAQAYVNLGHALAQRHLAAETLKTREQAMVITKKRFEAGIDAKTPSLQAESSLEAAKLAVYAADTNILKARNALQMLIGRPVPNELLPSVNRNMRLGDITSQTLFSTGLPSELLYYRPDIVQAEHSLKAAGANINVARAAYFPSIRLSSSIGFGSSSLDDLLKSSAFGWSFGPAISLPIFDAGSRRANHEMAQIAQKSALVNYEKTIQTAFKEVSDVLAERATLGQQIESQFRLQDNYQQTYNIAYARFRSGLDNYLTVLDAERSLFANQQGILQLELARLMSQIQLYQALGGGANLTAEQITEFNRQREAMRTATLASDEAQTAQPVAGESATVIAQPLPKADNDAAQSQ